MRYVTFYYDLLQDHISDLKVHKNKEAALKHFNTNCKNYFQLNTQFKADRLTASYGYPHRKYYGVSARIFKKMFNVSVDEAISMYEKTE